MITALTGFAVNASMLLLLLHTSPLSVAVASTTNVSENIFLSFLIVETLVNRLFYKRLLQRSYLAIV